MILGRVYGSAILVFRIEKLVALGWVLCLLMLGDTPRTNPAERIRG